VEAFQLYAYLRKTITKKCVVCDGDCRCRRDGAGELFIWSVLYFIDYEINKFTLCMLDYTRVRIVTVKIIGNNIGLNPG